MRTLFILCVALAYAACQGTVAHAGSYWDGPFYYGQASSYSGANSDPSNPIVVDQISQGDNSKSGHSGFGGEFCETDVAVGVKWIWRVDPIYGPLLPPVGNYEINWNFVGYASFSSDWSTAGSYSFDLDGNTYTTSSQGSGGEASYSSNESVGSGPIYSQEDNTYIVKSEFPQLKAKVDYGNESSANGSSGIYWSSDMLFTSSGP